MEEANEARVPAVVAILVTTDPGPWLEETLAGLAAQGYAELSVLVMVSGGTEDPTERIARFLPDAFVRRLTDDRGFGAAVNEALGMVSGAAFYLLCHDDCAPAPDAVHVLVEEAYRSNAGIVCPKMVRWDNPSTLLHVGMSADKTGAVVERVQPGEVDHGQHDGVRDVFVAPGGFTLVRADLMAELGGFDEVITGMGEDLDLSWRAQVAGSRVMVVPDAVVRHLEAAAAGIRPIVFEAPPRRAGADADAAPARADADAAPARADADAAPVGPTLQALERRHELRTVLKCYSPFHLFRVLPQVILLALGELTVSLLSGDTERASALSKAWIWNLSHLRDLRRARAVLAAHRVFPDSEVRRLQLSGSARLSTYASRLLHQGFDVAHGRTGPTSDVASGPDDREVLSAAATDRRAGRRAFGQAAGQATGQAAGQATGRALGTEAPSLTGSLGLAFSEDGAFDDLDDFGRRSRRRRQRRPSQLFTRHRSRWALWIVVALVLLIGTRGLFAGGLPLIGQLVPFPGWAAAWHAAFAGWQPAGVGSTAPPTPAYAIIGILGTLVAGSMGLLQKVLVIGCIPVGAWGVSRMLRPIASPRARLAGAIGYLGLALPYDALAEGRWDGLVAYAAAPWVLGRLARAMRSDAATGADAGTSPTGADAGASPTGAGAATGADAATPPAPKNVSAETSRGGSATPTGDWRSSLLGQMLVLGVIEALAVAFAPAFAVVVVVSAVAMVIGSAVLGRRGGALGVLAVAAGSTAVAAVLLLPWLIGVLSSGRTALSVLGLASQPASAPGWSDLLRFAVGPVGTGPLSWLLLSAAALAVLIGRGDRLASAGRWWVVAASSWVLALCVARGWTAPFSPELDVLLAPAAAAVAGAIGVGVAAFEVDLAGYRFGWRQVAAVLALLAAVVGVLPVVVEAGGGRWGLVPTGYAEPLSFLTHSSATTAAADSSAATAATSAGPTSAGPTSAGPTSAGPTSTGPTSTGPPAYRVLWLGDPRSLPGSGWSAAPGLAYSTSENGLPDGSNLWSPASPGPAARLVDAIDLLAEGRTSDVGHLLAPAAVRYIVVVTSPAPVIPGLQSPSLIAAPPDLLPALLQQTDLVEVSTGGSGYSVFANTDYIPERAEQGARDAGDSGNAADAGHAGHAGPGADAVDAWRPVLPGGPGRMTYSGEVRAGTVAAAYSPASLWHLTVDGRPVAERTVSGWVAEFRSVPPGRAKLSVVTTSQVPIGTALELALWALVAAALLGRRRWLYWWWRPARARWASRSAR